MPSPGSSLWSQTSSLLTEPVFAGSIAGLLKEVTKPRRADDLQDESIGSFISRRFGSAIADNLTSAIYHGIYAGDIYRLSARSILGGLWSVEGKHGSLVKFSLGGMMGIPWPMRTIDVPVVQEYQSRPPLSGILEMAKKSSVFTFKAGIGDLAHTIEAKLLEASNVDIKVETLIKELKLKANSSKPQVRGNPRDRLSPMMV